MLRSVRAGDGFSLIELLVVVAIIGILATIGIAVFLSQRDRAWQAELESDLRNTALEIAVGATGDDGQPQPPGSPGELPVDVVGFGTTVYFYDVDDQRWCLAGQRADVTQLPGTVVFDSQQGFLGYDENVGTGECSLP